MKFGPTYHYALRSRSFFCVYPDSTAHGISCTLRSFHDTQACVGCSLCMDIHTLSCFAPHLLSISRSSAHLRYSFASSCTLLQHKHLVKPLDVWLGVYFALRGLFLVSHCKGILPVSYHCPDLHRGCSHTV